MTSFRRCFPVIRPAPLQLFFYSLFCLLLCSPLFADQADVSYSRIITFEVKENRDGSYRLTSTVAVKQSYLSERSTKENFFRFSEPFFAKVTKVSGKFRNKKLKRRDHYSENAEHPDVFISDAKIHTVMFPDDIRQGETIYYQYKQEFSDIAFFPVLHVPDIDELQEFRVTIKHPKNIRVDFDVFFTRDSIPYQIDRSRAKETVLIFRKIPAQKELPYFPFNGSHASILTTLMKNGQPVTPTTPPKFLEWYAGKVNLKPAVNEELLQLLSERFTADQSEKEKLRIIHDYVRKNIRYIADEREGHAYSPRSPEFTLNNGYGDCKDRVYLVSALAAEQGIEVKMALVSTKPLPGLRGVHATLFNHVICMYEDSGKPLFFDPTARYYEFGNLPEYLVGAKTFILEPGNPRWISIEAPNHRPSLEIDITGSLDSPKSGAAKIVLRNGLFSDALRAKEKLSGVRLENALIALITSNIHKISLEHFSFTGESDTSLTLSAQADISKFIISSSAKTYIPQTPFLTVDSDILERENDPYPLYIPYRRALILRMDLAAPGLKAGAQQLRIGEDQSNFFASEITPQDRNRVEILYQFMQNFKFFSGDAKGRFLNFCKQYLQSKKKMFVLTRSKS